jgi:hypothetical protein
MKTEAQPETVMVFPRAVAIAVSELKERLQHDYEQTYPSLGEIIRIVVDEEEAHAWELSSFPHLLFPDLVQAHLENARTRASRHETRTHLGAADRSAASRRRNMLRPSKTKCR